MELVYQWFWLINLTFTLVTLLVAYKAAWVNRLRNKLWNTVFLILIVFIYIQPIKIQPTTSQVNVVSDKQIEQSHRELPPKIVDRSFELSTDVKSITPEELK